MVKIKKINSFAEKEKNNAVITHYRSRQYETKLFWNKCPRPAGTGIAPWNKNLLYIATTENKSVLIFDRSKTAVVDRLSEASMSCPHAVAFSAIRKEIYVSDKWNHCIHVFDRSNNYLRKLCGEKKILKSPEGIAVSPDDILFICDTGNDRVLAIDPLSANILTIYGITGRRTELNLPTGVTVTKDKVYIADNGNHRIKIYNIKGDKLEEIGAKGYERGQLKSPEVVVTDTFGYVLVGDSGNGRLQIFKPDGTFIRTIGEYGKTPGKFLSVSGISVTQNNEIIVSDSKNKTLQIF